MRRNEDAFAARGAALIAIGQGSGEAAERFCGKLHVGFRCAGDPDRASYAAFDFPRGDWGDVMWKPLLRDPRKGIPRIFRADMQGARTPGTDVKQLGGVAILAPSPGGEARIRFRYRQRDSSDMPETAALLAAVEGLG